MEVAKYLTPVSVTQAKTLHPGGSNFNLRCFVSLLEVASLVLPSVPPEV